MCSSRFFFLKYFFIQFILLLGVSAVFAQKYNFTHYDIEDGLVQSQVLKISQDRSHYLWIATYGGLSRFDGKEFISYTKSDGLATSMASALLNDSKGRVWVGSEGGIVCINGKKFSRYDTPGSTSNMLVRAIVEDKDGRIWITRKYQLFVFDKGRIMPSPVTDNDQYVTALTRSPSGLLYAAVYGKGIYCLKGNKWIKELAVSDSISISKIVFDRVTAGKLYILSFNQVYSVSKGILELYQPSVLAAGERFSSMTQDARGNLWIGTNNGAYRIGKNKADHFTSANGFTNSPVDDIFLDAESNIWLGTNGSGMFRFDGDGFISYNKINGADHIIMSMGQDSLKNVWMGTINNGLIKYDGKKFSTVLIPSPSTSSNTIYSIYNKPGQDMLVGTFDGLWSYNGRNFRNLLAGMKYPKIIYSLFRDYKGVLWMSAPMGCFYMENGKISQVQGIRHSSSMVLELGKDSVLAASNAGIWLIRNKKLDTSFKIPELARSSVICILRYKNLILAGTFGDGLFLVDLKTRVARKFDSRHGLYSNDIYSLAIDRNSTIWVGTGRGVNRLTADPKAISIHLINSTGHKELIECNQNASLVSGDKVWIGATKGLYIYNAEKAVTESKSPFIDIQSLEIINQKPSGRNRPQILSYSDHIPAYIKLNHLQNRLVISFRGIYLTNPDDISYRYRLKGLDEKFSQPIKGNMIEYPALLPGTYVFEVFAITGKGIRSNVKTLTFTINPPFYATILFRVLAILFLTALIMGIQYYWNYRKEKNKKLLEEIKRAEQQKIRRQTAEDFHDDIGNKLTRIAVLSDILNKQIGDGNQAQKDLIEQIKGNAATLYRGTKDILWALDPQSDNLYEILTYVQCFGTELFHSTGIDFIFSTPDSRYQKLQLPMEYSRNISMILKECFNNSLKHADATNVSISVATHKEGVRITVKDDGKGFDPSASSNGRGLNNMKVRAKRINGIVNIHSRPGEGTMMDLIINLDTTNYLS